MSKVSDAVKNAFESALFDDIDVTITASKVEKYHFEPNDYNPEGSDVIQLAITYRSDDDKELNQSYRISDGKYCSVSKDGASFDFTSDAKGLSKKSEFYHFITELANAGFNIAELDEDKHGLIDGLTSGKFHIKAEPVLDDEGKPKTHTSKQGKTYNTTKIIITKVLTLPWDKKGSAAKKTAPKAVAAPKAAAPAEKSTAAAPAAPASADEVKSKLAELVLDAVVEGPVTVQSLLAKVIRLFPTGDPNRPTAMTTIKDKAFLEAIDGVEYDGTKLKLAE